MARITRKELKTDKFALEVEHTVTFFEEHQKEIVRYGGIAVGGRRADRRLHDLLAAPAQRARRGAGRGDQDSGSAGRRAGNGGPTFPTQEAKDQEAIRVFTDLKPSTPAARKARSRSTTWARSRPTRESWPRPRSSFKEVAAEGRRQVRLAGQAVAGPDLLRRRPRRPGRKAAARSDGASHHLRLQGSGHHHAGALPGAKKPAEARKLLDPLRSRPGAVGTGGAHALRRDCRRSSRRARHAGAPAVSGGAKPGAALPRARTSLPQRLPARPRPRGPCPRLPPAGGQDPGLHPRPFRPFPQPPDPHHRGGADRAHRWPACWAWTKI